MPLRPLVFAAIIAVAALSAACGGGGASDDRIVLTPVGATYLPVVISNDLAVGDNRLLLGLIDQRDNSQVLDASLHARFFLLDRATETLKSEADLAAVRATKTYTHTHEDGTVESHEAGETGVYVTNVTFDSAGQWRIEITGTVGGAEMEPVRPVFDVRTDSQSPAVGEPAPRSRQLTSADVADLRSIDTSVTPIAEMHDKTIADAVSSGIPTVIVFATPAFCTSQICGPTKQIVDDLFAEYRAQANFVHIEPYDIEQARTGQGLVLQPFIFEEWGLTSEPWVFVVDSQGLIAAKFQGIVTTDELKSYLIQLIPA